MENNYLGVVIPDDTSCAKDVEQTKVYLFEQLNLFVYK